MIQEYVDQCSKTNKLIYAKMKLGFNEGDYIWDGEQIRLIGHDFIDLKETYNENHRPHFCFAMLEDEPLHVNTDSYPEEISFKHGLYVAESICNPVWIPTQEQLQNLLLCVGGDYTKLLKQFIHFTEYHNNYRALSKPKEQLWLEYFMWKKYSLMWDLLGKSWQVETNRLSEVQ